MPDASELNKYNKYFAIQCFNDTWGILDKAEKSEEDIEMALHLSHVSFWHWLKVEDHTDENVSIGYWMLSRVYAVAKKGKTALYYGNKCLDISLKSDLPPFSKAYAYEALARAYSIKGDEEAKKEALDNANKYAAEVKEEEDRNMLLGDLKTI